MKLPCLLQFRILKEAVRAAITGPYTSTFPFKPHIPEKAFRGAPEFHDDDCVGCTACAQVCPPSAITFEDIVENEKATRKLTLRYDMCIFCGQCQANCITQKGIILSNKFDLATFDRNSIIDSVEKELVLCEVCHKPVGAKDHIVWLAEQLGPLAYTNPTLFLSTLRQIKLASEMRPRDDISKDIPARRFDASISLSINPEPCRRIDLMQILCPTCRRKSVLKENIG